MQRSLLRWFFLCVWLLLSLSWRVLANPDEGRYAGVAYEMLQHDSWAIPLLNNMPYFHKPPLLYWMLRLSYSIFGVSEWGARFPLFLCALVLLIGLYQFFKYYATESIAWKMLMILVTTPLFLGGSQYVNMDFLLATWVSLAIMIGAHIVLSVQQNAKVPRMWQITLGAVLAGACLSKGVIGVLIPLGILTLWMLMCHRQVWKKFLMQPYLMIAFLLLSSPWVLIVQQQYPSFLHYFFVEQQFDRLLGTHFNNQQAWWFYIPILLFGIVPWSVIWVIGKKVSFWKYRTRARSGVIEEQKKSPFVIAPSLHALMHIWFWGVLLIFTIPPSKLIGYILPALVPLAYFCLIMVEKLLANCRWKKIVFSFIVFLAGSICMLLVWQGISLSNARSHRDLARDAAEIIQPEDSMYFIENYPFDWFFYSQLPSPAFVVDQWDSTHARLADHWRKELWDASQFMDDSVHNRLLISKEVLYFDICQMKETDRAWLYLDTGLLSISPYKDLLVWSKDNRYALIRMQRYSFNHTLFCDRVEENTQ